MIDGSNGRKKHEVKKRRSERHITYIAVSRGVTKSELQIAFELGSVVRPISRKSPEDSESVRKLLILLILCTTAYLQCWQINCQCRSFMFPKVVKTCILVIFVNRR